MMATKKPTAAQLRARKLFAERAKAGTLRKGSKKATKVRKPNPIVPGVKKRAQASSFEYHVETSANGVAWKLCAGFVHKHDAKEYAAALHKVMPGYFIRVNEA